MGEKSIEGKGGTVGPALCQVCGDPLEEDLVACRDCSTLHHRSCWRYNKGCAVYGCSCRASVETGEGGGRPEPVVVVERPVRLDRTTRFAVLAFLLVFGPLMPAIARIGPAVPILMVVFLYAGAILLKHGKWILELDAARGLLHRILEVSGHRVMGAGSPWVELADVVEVHHHRFEDRRRGRLEEIWLALRDGRRLFIDGNEERRSSATSFDGQALADRLAAAADVTVRTIASRRAPDRAEILAAARERSLLLDAEAKGEDEDED